MNIFSILKQLLFLKPRILKYRLLSNCAHVSGKPRLASPVLFVGNGEIKFSKNVQLGYNPSPFLYSHYSHIEARNGGSLISIGAHTFINNNASIVANDNKIRIGKNVLIGTSCNISNSDFHEIDSKNRKSGNPNSTELVIGDNVFIGNNVTILKGGSIGNNSVVGAGSIVTKKFPENVVIAGSPAKIIKKLDV